MSPSTSHDDPQVDRNYNSFREKLPDLIATHAGKLALMHDGEIVDFFDSYSDAIKLGIARFETIDRFSVQEVTDRTIALGIYSYAGIVS